MINQAYLNSSTLEKLQEYYNTDPDFSSVSMSQFLEVQYLTKIDQQIQSLGFRRDSRPIMHRRSRADVPDIIETLFHSKNFEDIFSAITGVSLRINEIGLFRFNHTDYQIIHDDNQKDRGFDIILDLTPHWDDDFGGYVVYTDGEGEFYTLSQSIGTLSIINRKELYRFVKYVNHYAANYSRYFVFVSSKDET